LEVIVVDNASNDGTWELLLSLAANEPRLKIFRNPTNIGPVRNWLACVDKAAGEYAKILWSDDLLHPEFLARTIPALADSRVGFVYSAVKIFDHVDPEQGVVCFDSLPTGVHPSRVFTRGVMLGKNFPFSPGCALLRTVDLRRNLLEHVPNSIGSDFSMHAIGNDLLLLLLTAHQYDFVAAVAEPLSYFRSHAGSISTSASEGRLLLHYDVAKAYFADRCMSGDTELMSKFNARLVLDKLQFDAAKFGIHRLHDFYPLEAQRTISYTHFVVAFLTNLRHWLSRLRHEGTWRLWRRSWSPN
jgi:glycosyltransferase involved in cell wall biosynthesis